MIRAKTGFIRSKLGWRVFGLFVVSALIPIAAIVVLTWTHVTRVLTEQGQIQLKYTSKAYATWIYDRLLVLEEQTRGLATGAERDQHQKPRPDLTDLFLDATLIRSSGESALSFSPPDDSPSADGAAQRHIAAGGAALLLAGAATPRIWLSRLLDVQHAERGILVAEINSHYLWGDAEELPFTTEACVLSGHIVLFCSSPAFIGALQREFVAAPMPKGAL